MTRPPIYRTAGFHSRACTFIYGHPHALVKSAFAYGTAALLQSIGVFQTVVQEELFACSGCVRVQRWERGVSVDPTLFVKMLFEVLDCALIGHLEGIEVLAAPFLKIELHLGA